MNPTLKPDVKNMNKKIDMPSYFNSKSVKIWCQSENGRLSLENKKILTTRKSLPIHFQTNIKNIFLNLIFRQPFPISGTINFLGT